MNTPVGREVTFYAVAAPGVDPSTVNIIPSVKVVGWKFGEIDKGELIDLVADVDKQLKVLDKWVEAARGILKQTLSVPEVSGTQTVTQGQMYQAEFKRSDRVALNQEKIKADYANDKVWMEKYFVSTPVLTLRIVPIPQTPAAV